MPAAGRFSRSWIEDLPHPGRGPVPEGGPGAAKSWGSRVREAMRLQGRKILITRTARQSDEFRRLLRAEGAELLEVPTIEIQPRRDDAVRQTSQRLAAYDWVVFTSGNAVDTFLDQLEAQQREAWKKELSWPRICAVGPATSRRLRQWQMPVHLIPEVYRAEGVVAAFRSRYPRGMKGVRVLFPAAGGARPVIPEELSRLGAEVDSLAIYDTVLPSDGAQRLRAALAQQPDLITFTSSSTVQNFVALAEPSGDLSRYRCAAIGPVTAQTARDCGLSVEVLPEESTIPALVGAVLDYFSRQ